MNICGFCLVGFVLFFWGESVLLDNVQFYTNFHLKKKKKFNFFNNNDSLKICIFSSCLILYKFSFKKQIYIYIFLIIIMTL